MKLHTYKTVAKEYMKSHGCLSEFLHPFIKKMILDFYSPSFELVDDYYVDKSKLTYNIISTEIKKLGIYPPWNDINLSMTLNCMRCGLVIGRKGEHINKMTEYVNSELKKIADELAIIHKNVFSIKLKFEIKEITTWTDLYDYEIHSQEDYDYLIGKANERGDKYEN